ncbi:hypothetical protein T01_11787 [Trichinella spiralis]|uniref:Uncharacterized protein n=1 Tax=Trichinella spiralis TaxID=6334 RepID=A0A0V1AGX8_TRISP|nr:hypothetical protein T01_11787 [Trichinella spiralis]
MANDIEMRIDWDEYHELHFASDIMKAEFINTLQFPRGNRFFLSLYANLSKD